MLITHVFDGHFDQVGDSSIIMNIDDNYDECHVKAK